jgi:uncharacterized circularly permuted ATP-grasp superfamily protein
LGDGEVGFRDVPVRLERGLSAPNEVFASDHEVFPHYRPVLAEMDKIGAGEWDRRVRHAHGRMLEEQRGVGISDDDMTHPTDYVPRVIPTSDWDTLERGLSQRMLAVNEWLRRLEAGKDEVVPREVLQSSALYDASIPTRFGSVPNRQMGIDVVAVWRQDGWEYLVIEDNAKMPVGLEPMALMRARTAEVLPESYAALGVRPLNGLMERLGEVLRAASKKPDPTLAILSTGPDDQYYLDHRVFAEELGAVLAERHEVEVDRDVPGTQRERAPAGRNLRAYRRRKDLRRPARAHRIPGGGEGRGRLRSQPRHSRRQGRLSLYSGHDPDLPRRRAGPPERRDLLAGRRR